MATEFLELDDEFGIPTSAKGDGGNFASFEERFPDVGGTSGSNRDFESSAAAYPALDDEGFGEFDAPLRGPDPPAIAAPLSLGPRPQPGASFVTNFEGERPFDGRDVTVTGNDELSAFENQFPEIATTIPAALPKQNGFTSTPSYSQPPQPPQSVEPDSPAIREWRQKQSEEIARRDQVSMAKHQETIEKAEKAIDDFYQDYSAKKELQIAKNKEEEAAFLSKQTDALAQGTVWSRIGDLIELQDSRSKTNTRSTHDLSRMKEVLLALKREGDIAPGAAGY